MDAGSVCRRGFLRGCGLALGGSLAGCSEPVSGDLEPELTMISWVEPADEGWSLTVDLAVSLSSLHDVTVLAYDAGGAAVCRADAGDFDVPGVPASQERRVTATCEAFPAIVTATAAETPCDGARLEVQYWVGTDAQRGGDHPDDVVLWRDTFRRCDEALPPPPRVVDAVGAGDATDSAGDIRSAPEELDGRR